MEFLVSTTSPALGRPLETSWDGKPSQIGVKRGNPVYEAV
jgi:hypothetical protein